MCKAESETKSEGPFYVLLAGILPLIFIVVPVTHCPANLISNVDSKLLKIENAEPFGG